MPIRLLACLWLLVLMSFFGCATQAGRSLEAPSLGSGSSGIPADVLLELDAIQPSTVVIENSKEYRFGAFQDGQQFTKSKDGNQHCIQNRIYGWKKCFKYTPARLSTDDKNDRFVVVLYGAAFDESFIRSAYYPKIIVLDFKTGEVLATVERAGKRPPGDSSVYQEPLAVRGNILYYQLAPCCKPSAPAERTTGVITVQIPR